MYNSQCRCRFKLRRQHHFLLQLLDIIIVILRKLSHSFLLAYDDDNKNEFFEYMQKKIVTVFKFYMEENYHKKFNFRFYY